MAEKSLTKLISGDVQNQEARVKSLVTHVGLHIRAVYEPVGGVHAAELSPQDLKQQALATLLDAKFPNCTVEPLMETYHFDALMSAVRDLPLSAIYEAAGRFVDVAKIASNNNPSYMRRVTGEGISH